MMTPDEPDLSGAELALGVLDGEARAAALRRVLAEPAFAREVDLWRERFAAWYLDWPEAEPGPAAAQRAATIPRLSRVRTGRWQWIAAASSLAAAVLLLIVITKGPAPAPIRAAPSTQALPPLVAVVKPNDGEPFSAVFSPVTREVRLTGAVKTPPGHTAELWAIGKDGVPHAAGILTSKAGERLVVAGNLPTAAGTTFAISIEPAGGSPKPAPTGPVVASGTLFAI